MSDTITISKAELQAMISEGIKSGIAGLSEGGNSRILRRVTDRTVEVRMVDDRVVIGYVNKGSDTKPLYIYDKPDPNRPGSMIQFVDLVLEGMKNEESFSIAYTEFLKETERVKAKVVKTEEKEWVLNQGVVKKREVEEYSSIELDFDVPLDVVGKTVTFTVKLPVEKGEREVVVGSHYVNI